MSHPHDSTNIYDVAIVGYGPVGQLLAALLGQRGHRVLVVERYAAIYPMPRAVHFDDEVARILQSVGIRADENPIIEPYDDWYEWRNADRETLLRVDWRGVGPSWWNTANFFAQPDLERELDAAARSRASVTVRRETVAIALAQDEDGVTVTVSAGSGLDAATEDVRARYLIGCDGANSTVAALLGIEREDLGFFFDWLIVDVVPSQPMAFEPPAWQLCDPKRPTTIVPGGPGRRRWEFMALPGEDAEQLNRAETAWELLEPWGVTPQTATMERHTVYRFQARWAHSWRQDRVLLAGDAAHLMPPFAGQGMCGGLRDVFNLVWKLDLVLAGIADEELLDTYQSERLPHVRHFIGVSIELGRLICVPDANQAAERDRQFLAAMADPSLAPPAPPTPRLGLGLGRASDPAAGTLSIQSRVRYDGQTGLFDDVVGRGWFLLTDAHADVELTASHRELLTRLDAKVLRLGPAGCDPAEVDVVDLDGRYADWFAALNASVVIVRPDFYVYSATDATGVGPALDLLQEQLTSTVRAPKAVPA